MKKERNDTPDETNERVKTFTYSNCFTTLKNQALFAKNERKKNAPPKRPEH